MTPLLQQMHDRWRAARDRLDNPVPKPQVIQPPPPPLPPEPKVIISMPPEPLRPPGTELLPVTRAKKICEIVANDFEITVEEMMARSRKIDVRPRHIAIYLIDRANTCWSTPMLGRFFRRDHTTIVKARRKIARERAKDPRLDATITYLEYRIGEIAS